MDSTKIPLPEEKVRKYFCDWCSARWEELSFSDEDPKHCLECGSTDVQLFPETRDYVNPKCAGDDSPQQNRMDCNSCNASCSGCPLA
jgi:hypothetical protein